MLLHAFTDGYFLVNISTGITVPILTLLVSRVHPFIMNSCQYQRKVVSVGTVLH